MTDINYRTLRGIDGYLAAFPNALRGLKRQASAHRSGSRAQWRARGLEAHRGGCRRHCPVAQITSPTLPTGEFSLSYRVRQDKHLQRDDTVVPETPIDLQLTDVEPKVSEYPTPGHEGTYFVELMNNIIDIPSKNYYLNARDWSGGKTLGITTGRYMCPKYDAHAPANACTWSEPVNTDL